jgi:unsaturated rhamnogalacturonyl hydrolase
MDDFGFVQGVCGAPEFNRPGTSTEGQAFCILMETAAARVRRLSPA